MFSLGLLVYTNFQSQYQRIGSTELEFIPPINFQKDGNIDMVSYSESNLGISFSFLVINSSSKKALDFSENTITSKGSKFFEKYQLSCAVEKTDLFLMGNEFMPGYSTEELIAMFHDGRNMVVLNCFFHKRENFEKVKDNLINSFSSIRLIQK